MVARRTRRTTNPPVFTNRLATPTGERDIPPDTLASFTPPLPSAPATIATPSTPGNANSVSNYRNIKILRKNVSRWSLDSAIPLPVWIMELELGLNLLEQEGNQGQALRAAVAGVLDGGVALSWAEVTQGSALRPARYPATLQWPPQNVNEICAYFISLYVREDEVMRQRHLLENMVLMSGENYENFSQRVRMVGRYVKLLYKPWASRLPAFDVDSAIRFRLLWACGEPLGTRLRDQLKMVGIDPNQATIENIIQTASGLTASEASAVVYGYQPTMPPPMVPSSVPTMQSNSRLDAGTLLGSAMRGLPGYWTPPPTVAPAPRATTEPQPATNSAALNEVTKQVSQMVKTINDEMATIASQLRNLNNKRTVSFMSRGGSGYPRQRSHIPQEVLRRMACHNCGEKGHLKWQCNKPTIPAAPENPTKASAATSGITEL
jgi:hypothetical protein